MNTFTQIISTLGGLGNIIAIAAVIIAVLAWRANAKSAKIAAQALHATNAVNEAHQRPYISATVYIDDHGFFHLLVKNEGKSVASALNFTLINDFFVAGDPTQNLKNMKLFKKTLHAFAPGSSISFFLGQGHTLLEKTFSDGSVVPTCLDIAVEYFFGEKRYTDEFQLDIDLYEGSWPMQHPVSLAVGDLVTKLDGVQKTLALIERKM